MPAIKGVWAMPASGLAEMRRWMDEGPAQERTMVVIRPHHGSASGGLTGRSAVPALNIYFQTGPGFMDKEYLGEKGESR